MEPTVIWLLKFWRKVKHTIPVLTGSLSGACCSSCWLGRWYTTTLGAELQIFSWILQLFTYILQDHSERTVTAGRSFSIFCDRDEDNTAEFFFQDDRSLPFNFSYWKNNNVKNLWFPTFSCFLVVSFIMKGVWCIDCFITYHLQAQSLQTTQNERQAWDRQTNANLRKY